MKCHNVLIAIGSNLPGEAGSSLGTCNRALAKIDSRDIRITGRARWRRSPAFPAGSGPDFVNGAIRAETSLSATDVLNRLHEVEAELGRVRRLRWGPRVCDLDLIAYGDFVSPDPETLKILMREGATAAEAPNQMILPHPRMQERAFVLAPLSDVAPAWRHPATGLTVMDMLAALTENARADVTVIEAE